MIRTRRSLLLGALAGLSSLALPTVSRAQSAWETEGTPATGEQLQWALDNLPALGPREAGLPSLILPRHEYTLDRPVILRRDIHVDFSGSMFIGGTH